MRIILCAIACLLMKINSSSAQIKDPSVIASAGGNVVTPTMLLDWTLGEYAVETITTPNNLYSQGFNQPFLYVKHVSPVLKNNYAISIGPNPVLSLLNFRIQSPDNNKVVVSVADVNGRTFIQKSVYAADGNLQLDFNSVPAGTYILHVRDAKTGQLIQTFEIIRFK